ncbi:uncharacterized protein EAE97_006474 [Botrytis byssoidea]|uniref:Xylanolytic transcriptional activator regulatory domain-containing protein n=1 Tax=Botrytis byssoidea TaxID=139641 RepID=A0A9P5ILN1_9HELO|nr:uncharacterized protein EAE97_006474 [Botrytis byssoidea]KAF7941637.1 hypothetical protein EAE97_006474 [Botrytis byssoidea]
MSKILNVVGATGAQGGSVVADTSDLASLVKAFEGSYAIFVVTDFFASFATKDAEETVAIESTQGINCAKAASKTTTLEHYIWSTLPDNQKISNGKCSVPHFESKTKVDEYIRQYKALLAKTTFLFITYYATNILMPMFTPTLFKTTGKHVQLLPIAEDTPITTLGATVINTLGLVSKEHFEARLRYHFAQKDMADDDPAWYALRNTVYASCYRLGSSNMPYSNMSGEIQGQAWRYFEKALDVHTELLYGSTGLMAVQALTAMGFFAEGLAGPSLAYMLVSCATRLAQAKGLHRQPAQSWNLPLAKQQHRVRLFWTLYILEKHISYRSGRPSIIEDDDISCPFPSTQLANNTTYIDPFIYIIQHAQISSRIAKQLTSGSSLFGSGQSSALRSRISISSHAVVNAARAIILDTDAIQVDASTPIWLAFYFPLVSAINIFIYILKYPALPTTSSDVALLDICTGHFSRLELASPDTALPFIREIARLARSTVESVKNSAASPGSLLGADVMAPSVAQPSVPHARNLYT